MLRWGAWVTLGVGVCWKGATRYGCTFIVWGRGRGEQGASNWTNKLTFFKIQIMLYFSHYHLSLWFCLALKKPNKKSFAIYDHKLHKTRPPSCEKSHRILIIHNQRCRFIPSCVREDDPPRNKLLLTSPNGVHWPTPRETRYESGA